MLEESELRTTEHGLVATGDGWFVLNARDAPWYERDGRGFYCEFEGFEDGAPDFLAARDQRHVLRPGEPMAMYHWEADQEDFLVVAGEALLVVEGKSARFAAGISSIAHRGRSTRSSGGRVAAA